MTTGAAVQRSLVDRLAVVREGGVAVAALLAFIVFTAIQSRFAQSTNLKSIALQTSIFAVLAVGQTIVILTRNIDLSVGSTLGVAAILAATQLRDHPDLGTGNVLLMCVGVGLACGLLNGVLVAFCEIPSIVATLGTFAVFRGIADLIGENKSVSNNLIPERIGDLALKSPFGLPWLDVMAIVTFVLAGLYLGRTRSGRYFYAVGSNPAAASARGVPVRRTILAAFALSGAVAGLGGAMYVAKFGFVDPQNVGTGYELWAISAVVVGGTSILGGSGGIGHTFFGVLLIGIVSNGLTITGLTQAWQIIVQGLIILIAISVDSGLRSLFAARRQIARRRFA